MEARISGSLGYKKWRIRQDEHTLSAAVNPTMKAALILICLSLVAAAFADGNPCDGNNRPDCSLARNQNVMIRNFWDPTRFWKCNGSTAIAVTCEEYKGKYALAFDAALQDCVAWSDWQWVPPCPT